MPIIPFPASVEQWRPVVEQLAPDLPIDFVLKWIQNESGGNPCATGLTNPSQFEAGIFQVMLPQDLRYGATLDQLRQGCAQATPGVIGSGSQLLDPSAVDQTAQVAGLNLVRDYVGKAAAALAGSGVSWTPDSTDFWIAVKQVHALPGVLTALLPQVVKRFGPPDSWNDFKDKLFQMPQNEVVGRVLSSTAGGDFWLTPSVHGLRNRVEDTMLNAEETGKFGGGVRADIAKLGGAGPFLLLGAAATLLYLLWRR